MIPSAVKLTCMIVWSPVTHKKNDAPFPVFVLAKHHDELEKLFVNRPSCASSAKCGDPDEWSSP